MTGDCHVRFCEGLGGKFPRSTRQLGHLVTYLLKLLLRSATAGLGACFIMALVFLSGVLQWSRFLLHLPCSPQWRKALGLSQPSSREKHLRHKEGFFVSLLQIHTYAHPNR